MTGVPSSESIELSTADGLVLQAELAAPLDPVAVAVICHPHPTYGGDMDNHVVSALFDHWSSGGTACLRFNFRGAGRSQGSHGGGRAERADVSAAVAEMADRWPTLPLLLAGYSFGADVALSLADEAITAWFLVAPVLQVFELDEFVAGSDGRPKTIVSGSADEFRPSDQAAEMTAAWTNCTVTAVEGANHFFLSGLRAVLDVATRTLTDLAEPDPGLS